ncbi:hypothetical protein [Dyadobacter frigoris]|uniref:Uncharacterized protein n=1 Tax=Dyadobacter frigoris TaxID=2576211 RepID=A0A4U6D0S0_9BACT|nr:hypothetical protein [Dyadobacter frigoris]TKT87344.1 hypothetical protein FDK13_30325 [Dyadobacter frigoris]GLU55665.1 hypothetical protein Dfri01_51260 [Dyadobacter frigoris]
MKVLMISTVQAFFRQRSGMFFVLMGLLFGFLSGREHYAFAVFFLTDPFGMLYLGGIWLLYTLLCLHFVKTLWIQPEYNFIYNSRLWPVPKRFLRFGFMALGFLQPILYYGIYMISIAKQDRLLGKIWPIFVWYILLSLLLVVLSEWRIRNPVLYHSKNKTIFNWPFPRPVSWIYWSVEWLFRERGITLLACKAGAIGVAMCTLIYYNTDNYDLRLPAVGLSLGYLLNVGISFELFHWENEVWLWNRSLPISTTKRFIRILLSHALIIIPETLIAAKYQVLSLFEIIQLYGLGLAVLMLFHTYLYKHGGILEDLLKPLLIGFVILTLLILYKIPVWGLAGSGLISSYYLYSKWYGRNEIGL